MADVTDVATGRVRRPEWVAHVLDDSVDPPRAVLLHLPSGRRVGLSDTATRVWKEIVASGTDGVQLRVMTAVLAPEYGVDPAIISEDVVALLSEMVDGEWVEIVPDISDGGHDGREGGTDE